MDSRLSTFTYTLACHLLVATSLAAPLVMSPEPTPDPSLTKGKCAVSSRVMDVCDMCGSLGLDITTAECCMSAEAYEGCKYGLLRLLDLLEETTSSMQPSDDDKAGGSLGLDDMFPVKRYSPLFSPISWQGDSSTEEDKRGKLFRNYNRMWYKGGKRAGYNRLYNNYNHMWYKG